MYNGVGDLYHMYLVTQRAGASFNLAYTGDDFHAEHKEDFDQTYMRALYHYAYETAVKGYPWQHAPPGFAGKGPLEHFHDWRREPDLAMQFAYLWEVKSASACASTTAAHLLPA
ncbi:MAG: hypothetical protein ACREH9_08170 [Pseudomonadota bacterium]